MPKSAGQLPDAAPDSTVKSAARVFQVLELFRDEARPLKATEVALMLGWPKSSTSAILRSLLGLGYLSYDRNGRRYFPTLRVTMLGEWLPQHLSDVPDIARVMDAVQAATEETVTLSMRNGFAMQVLRLRQCNHVIALNIREGFRIPLFPSAVGQAFLATQPEAVVRQLLAQYRASPEGQADDIAPKALLARLAEVRQRGYAVAYAKALPDTGAVAMALPAPAHQVPLVIAVAGLAARMHEQEAHLIGQLREHIGAL